MTAKINDRFSRRITMLHNQICELQAKENALKRKYRTRALICMGDVIDMCMKNDAEFYNMIKNIVIKLDIKTRKILGNYWVEFLQNEDMQQDPEQKNVDSQDKK